MSSIRPGFRRQDQRETRNLASEPVGAKLPLAAALSYRPPQDNNEADPEVSPASFCTISQRRDQGSGDASDVAFCWNCDGDPVAGACQSLPLVGGQCAALGPHQPPLVEE